MKISQHLIETQEQKRLISTSENGLEKLTINTSSKEEKSKQIKNFLILLGSLLFSVFKLCWILIFRLLIFIIKSALQPLYGKIIEFVEKIFNGQSLNSFLQHSIVVVSSLQQRIPQCFDSFITTIRSSKKNKSLQFSQRKQYTEKENRQMFLEPIKYLQSPSNQVLCRIKEAKNKITLIYYVPVYLRVLLKNFTSIDLGKLQAEVNANIIITFVYGNKGLLKLPRQVANRLNNEVVLNFERDQPLRLASTDSDHVSVKQEENKSYITFTVRRKFRMKIQSDVAYTPFQNLDLLLPITIQQLTPATILSPQQIFNESFLQQIRQDTIYEAGIRFNFMDNSTPFVKLDFKDQTSFGHYSIIQSGLQTKCSDKKILSKEQQEKKKIEIQKQKIKSENQVKKLERKRKLLEMTCNQKQKKVLAKQIQNLERRQENKTKLNRQKKHQQQEKKKDPDYFQYSCFKIPIYKHPFASLIQIFLPLWSLAIINLGIYFQDGSLSDRIASIAGVMIAFIALIPLIRSEIPPNPKVVFVEYLVYLEIFASLLCLIDSFIVRDKVEYRMVWYQNGFFLISLLIFLTQILAISILTINHYAICVHTYQLDEDQQEWKKDKNKNKFNHFFWGNKDCDKKFEHVIQNTKEQIKKMNNGWEGKLTDLKQQIQTEKQTTLHQISSKKALKRMLISTERLQRQQSNPFKKTESKLSMVSFTSNPSNQSYKNIQFVRTKFNRGTSIENQPRSNEEILKK